MNTALKVVVAATGFLFLVACASGPISTEDTFTGITLDDAVNGDSVEGSEVLWGGVILSTNNLEDSTLIEVLAYPLDRRQRPMKSRQAEGRFLIVDSEFLEPTDYSEGRSITVLGTFDGVTTGNIAAASYEYPTVTADQLHLWRPGDDYVAPRFTIGIGLEL